MQNLNQSKHTVFSRISICADKTCYIYSDENFHPAVWPCEHRADFRVASSDSSFCINFSFFELYLMLTYIQKKRQTECKWRLLVIDTFISFVTLMIMVFYKALLCEIGCTAVHKFWTEAQFELKGEKTQCLYTLHLFVCLFLLFIRLICFLHKQMHVMFSSCHCDNIRFNVLKQELLQIKVVNKDLREYVSC